MTTPTIGKVRGLAEIATRDDLFTILALDQRGSLARALGIETGDPATYRQMRDFKLSVLDALLDEVSATLIDPEYVAAEAVAAGVVPGDTGFIVSLEKSGYLGEPTAREQTLLDGWSVGKVKLMGASAAKLFFDYHPEGTTAASQEALVSSLVEAGREYDIPLLAEPVSYSPIEGVVKKSAEFAALRPQIVVETVRRIGALGPDVLKLEFPYDAAFNQDEDAWLAACEEMTEVSPVPWALLSAGVDYDVFRRQVEVACRAGASGFVAGRAIWKEATTMQGEERTAFLNTTGRDRMKELVEVVHGYGRPWRDHYPGLTSSVGDGWLANYAE
jgi:tagatose 1,6-diphosphate aldolase